MDTDGLKQQGLKPLTRKVLSYLDNIYQDETGVSFRDKVTTTQSTGLEKKKNKVRKEGENRNR